MQKEEAKIVKITNLTKIKISQLVGRTRQCHGIPSEKAIRRKRISQWTVESRTPRE